MAKTCPSCGHREPDNQALYCNKCGYPFPENRPRGPAVAPAPAVRPVPRPSPRPVRRRARGSGILSFDSLITENHLRLIYIIGAVLIVLVSVMGIAGMFSKTAPDKEKPAAGTNASFINTTAIAEYPAGSPVFWIVFLIAGSVLWRMFCELFALLSRVHAGNGPQYEDTAGSYGEIAEYGDEGYADAGEGGPGQMVECPKCRRIVAIDDLRECEHCGIQGCVNCIRSMGLLKKSLTCRECFEAK